MKKALYVPCYPGELGWELINYAPYVNHICSKGKFKEVHIVVRNGRQALYPMGTHFYPISLTSAKSMGNNGPRPPADNIVKNLSATFDVQKLSFPKGGCKYVKYRKHLKYKADPKLLWEWRHIPDNSVVCCVRGRKFGRHKNWPGKHWHILCEFLLEQGLTPVVTGLKELTKFDLPPGCIDAQDKTTMGDLLAIFARSKFAIGGSTGPMHFASLSGTPHVVWGTSRIKDRYFTSWNPHKTPVEYLTCEREFQCSPQDVYPLATKMIERIG